MSVSFVDKELDAVTALAAQGRLQESIAKLSGLSLSSFKRAFEGDEKLRDAWHIGKAIRREQRIADLEEQSKKGNVRATELLLRFEHRDAGPQTNIGGRGDINININAETIARAVDGRTYSSLMKRIQHDRTPALIEHEPIEQPVDIDPIEAVKQKQRLERTT